MDHQEANINPWGVHHHHGNLTPHLDGPEQILGDPLIEQSSHDKESLHRIILCYTHALQALAGPFALAALLATYFMSLLLPIYTLVSDPG